MANRAFTIIELLVTVSIVAVLLAVLLPSLSQAKASVRSVSCANNQRQQLIGWQAVIDESHKSRFPYTFHPTSTGVRWYEIVQDAFGYDLLDPRDQPTPDAPNVCPAVESSFDRPNYRSFYTGYVVNTRWLPDGEAGDNELKPLDGIRNPSNYPVFSEAAPHPDWAIAEAHFGHTASAFGAWGLALPHEGSGWAAFADASVRSVVEEDLYESDTKGTPVWLLNR